MEVIFYLTLLLLANFSRGDENTRREEEQGIENDGTENDAQGLESFGSPIYGGLNNILRGPGGKSAYNAPVPASLASTYGAYVASLGLGNPYAYGPYSRYGFMPYANPYSYGASLFNNPTLNSVLLAGYGYAGYGGPYFGRSALPGYGYGYPGYNAGLGYRFGGLGYPPAAVRGPAPVPGVPAPVPGLPVPAARVPAPVAAFPPPVPNAVPGFPAPVPAALPRPLLRPIQNKDGSVRYGYGPADLPGVPVY